MGSASVLSEKDANTTLKNLAGTGASKADIKSMEYHRQVLKSKMEEEKYGHTATATTTTTITTNNNNSITTIIISPSAVGASSSTSSGLGTTTAVNPMQASSITTSSSQKIIHIHRTLAGLAANPNASGTRSSAQQYISPSDNIMSPCTAKLNALKGRHAGKAKPKSLFAQASAKKFVGENVFGARSAEQTSSANGAASNSNNLQPGL
ncbi:hypothetical protein F5B22DRAFT_332716 [Xylaria bambusicola]|uniref:uncharacterized protein n=1 Tax=Xylaria bambusicola TaxID=326684 RepID=UPI002007AC66|nr:uncharacterized protein F5B22DRAFT_332716 [Xylaria bambusicola]KAI0525302.1 hypothetical protein F5B22DRAFT_332716 [Xylaria bambusicola]